MGMPEYLAKIKALTDEIAYTGSSLGDGEIVSFILKGLDMEYNSVVSALSARVEPVTVIDLYNQLLSFEARINLLQQGNLRQSSVNALTRGRGYGGRGRGHQGQHGRGRGGNNNYGRGRSNNNNNNGARSFNNNNGGQSGGRPRPRCQLCKKLGHEVLDCWHRYDEDYVPEERHVLAALREQGGEGETVWYTDSGATDHITSELEKLAFREKYYGKDPVNTAANGGGMKISHIGQSSHHRKLAFPYF